MFHVVLDWLLETILGTEHNEHNSLEFITISRLSTLPLTNINYLSFLVNIHIIIHLLGCILWDWLSNEHIIPLIMSFHVSYVCVLESLRQATIIYHNFFNRSPFFGKEAIIKLLSDAM